MNVFILNAGRCGSTTFIKSCQHIDNYTAAHESRTTHVGPDRLNYPANHIEADNRLSWFLGRLDQLYGDNAFYVHLLRNSDDTVNSFMKRTDFGIMKAYREGIYLSDVEDNLQAYAKDYIETVNSNIRHFLKDKTHTMNFKLDNTHVDFNNFWEQIAAKGNKELSLSEWDKHYTQS